MNDSVKLLGMLVQSAALNVYWSDGLANLLMKQEIIQQR